MGARKRLGLIFSFDDQWIGGTYYIINLIHAFNSFPDFHQPEIVIFSKPEDFTRLRSEVNYQYLIYEFLYDLPLNKWQRGLNRLFGKKIFRRLFKGTVDFLFLNQMCGYLDSIPLSKRIYWIPDFQDKHFPDFFTDEGLRRKDEKSKWIALNASHLILSSESVRSDWMQFYPNHNCKVHVVRFAVTHALYNHLNIVDLLFKFGLSELYFMCPNQFWAHKNHMVVIRAAEILKEQGRPVVIAFSGKENDNRNPGYTEKLKKYVSERGLDDVVRFLGFLNRTEQLQIMKHARAIIQPSMFEGWSTVIEDAMAMNQPVIASDIPVNREQLGNDGVYFSFDDHVTLAELIYCDCLKLRSVEYNYQNKLLAFAQNFMKIIS
jgi:glycosyltransferase involved in cell wall biosynthesis